MYSFGEHVLFVCAAAKGNDDIRITKQEKKCTQNCYEQCTDEKTQDCVDVPSTWQECKVCTAPQLIFVVYLGVEVAFPHMLPAYRHIA